VRDLDAMLAQLAEAGIPLAREQETSDFGRFAWGIDPEGNRFELWEPPEGK
jgi:predicted enzyme related to lactoylglutathione lyase